MLNSLLAATTASLPGSERTLAAVLQALRDDRLLLLDARGFIRAASRPAAEWLGTPADELLGSSLGGLMMAEDREAGLPEQLLEKARRRGEAHQEIWLRKPAGVESWASLHLACHEGPEEPEYVLTLAPGLRGPDELDRLRALLRYAPAGLWMTNAAGHLLEVSPQFARYSAGAGAGDHWPAQLNYVSPDQRAAAGEARRNAHVSQLPYRIEYFDQQKRHLIESGEPRLDAQGGFVGFVGSLAETAAMAAPVVDSSFDFLARLSNDVREQCSRILQALELAAEGNKHLAGEQGDVIEGAAQTLLRQVENVAVLWREPRSRERIVFDPQPLLRDLIEDAAEVALQTGRGLEAQVDWVLPPRVLGDVSGLRQLLRVMLEHAVLSAAPGSDPVLFELAADSPARPGEIPLRARVNFSGREFEPGLEEWLTSPDAPATAFGDAGIRLRLARHAALMLGGSFDLGPGSLACQFTLAEAPAEAAASERFTSLNLAGKRVLVVAQEPLTGVLAMRGAELALEMTAFETGFEAKEWLAQPGREVDLAIIQYAMPGLDGCDLGRWLRAKRPDLPMITVSMQGEPGQGKAAREAGFQGYLTPPLATSLLEDACKLVLTWGTRGTSLVTRFRIEEVRAALQG